MKSETDKASHSGKRGSGKPGWILPVLAALGLAARIPVFISQSFTMMHGDRYGNYLSCLEQVTTGHPAAQGNAASFGFPNLGPFVFYIYGLFLLVWKSPLCLIVLSLAVNLAAPLFLAVYFYRKRDALTGIAAAAIVLMDPLHARLVGDIWPHVMLPLASVLWAGTFSHAMEKKSGVAFVLSFLFLALAASSHFSGFLLVAVCVILLVVRRPGFGVAWTCAGIAVFLLPYTVYIARELGDTRPYWGSVFQALQGLFRGTAFEGDARSVPEFFQLFLRNGFGAEGVAFWLLSLFAMGAGLRETFGGERDPGVGRRWSDWTVWAAMQAVSIPALVFVNSRPWFFLVYCAGSYGSIAHYLGRRFRPGGRPLWIIIVLALLPLGFVVKDRLVPYLIPGYSYFPVYSQTVELAREDDLGPGDVRRFHTLLSCSMNVDVGHDWPAAILATAGTGGGRDADDTHFVFSFCKKNCGGEYRMIEKALPGGKEGSLYYSYTSRINYRSWYLCPGGLQDLPDGYGVNPPGCSRVKMRFTSADAYSGDDPDGTGNGAPAPFIEPGKTYTFSAYMEPAGEGTDKRLIVVQTDRTVAPVLLHNGKAYDPSGTSQAYDCSGSGVVADYTWFAIPATPGPVAFEWRYGDPPPDYPDNYPIFYLDVMDIDLPPGAAVKE